MRKTLHPERYIGRKKKPKKQRGARRGIERLNKYNREHEAWRPLPSPFSTYYDISSYGRVRRHTSKGKTRLVKAYVDSYGNKMVQLHEPRRTTRRVARLVAAAFRPDIKLHLLGFKNGDRLDARATNLKELKRNSKLSPLKVAYIKLLLAEGNLTLAAIAKKYKVKRVTIEKIALGAIWTKVQPKEFRHKRRKDV